jgi:hypothetical protein
MGFSSSGLSLVTTAAAELGTGGVVHDGARSGLQGSKLFLSSGEPAREEEGNPTDSESGLPLPAVSAPADGKPSQLKDASSQAKLFSSLWTSAAGFSDPESTGAGPDSFSILTSEELFPARGAFLERPPAVHAATQGAVAVAVGDFLRSGTRWQGLAGLPGAIVKDGSLPALPDTGVLECAACGSAAALGTAGAAKIPATEAAGYSEPTGAEGHAEQLADLDSLALTRSGKSVPSQQAAPEHALSRLPELLAAQSTAGRADHANERRSTALPRQHDTDTPVEESTDPTDKIPGYQVANASAALAGAGAGGNSIPPGPVASAAPARPAAQANHLLPAKPAGVTTTAVGSDGPATAMMSRSEVAFQAEIHLNDQPRVAGPLASNAPREVVARWTAPAAADAPPTRDAGDAPQTEFKLPAGTQTAAQALAFRKQGEHAEPDGSFPGHGQTGGNPDRGAPTAPLSHAPSVMDARPAAASMVSARPQPAPAAAHLDAGVPLPALETGGTARSVAFKIQSEGQSAANVVLTDRGNQVHVTVRSSDPQLAHSLRSDLGSLAGGLQQQGFDVRFIHTASGSHTNSEPRANSGDFLSQDDFRGDPRHRHSSADTGQRHRRPAEWTEEFD